MYYPPDKVRAIIHALHDTFADEHRAADLLKQLREAHPSAFATVVALCRTRHDSQLAATQATLPPRFDDLAEGDLDAIADGSEDADHEPA
ncbi:MAG: hypothetical protein JSV79_09285 [Armatimonadota bacterium]|nr:MAG: hypothetical protein JSV79_09285 [Armatimonadota bacterium]